MVFFLIIYVTSNAQETYHIPEDRIEPKGDLEMSLFTYGNSPKDYIVRYPGSEYIVLKIKNVGTVPVSNWKVCFYLSEINKSNRHGPNDIGSYLLGQSLTDYCHLETALAPGETYTYRDRYYINCEWKEIPTPPNNGTEYLLYAYLVFNNLPNRDLNSSNNSKSIRLLLKPKINRSDLGVKVVNNGTTISLSNLSENYLGGKIVLSGLNDGSIRYFDIKSLNDIVIENKYGNPDILMIKIIDQSGKAESFKIRN